MEFIRRGLGLDDIEVVNMACVGRREGKLGVVKIEVSSKVQKNKDAESKEKIEGQRELQEMVSTLQQAIRAELQESQTTEILRAVGLGKLYFFNDMGRFVRKKELVDADDHRIESLNETDAQLRLQKEEKKYCEQRENRNGIKTNLSDNSKNSETSIAEVENMNE